MSVYGHDSFCIFIYDDSVRIHAEGTDIVLEFLSAVYDLAFVEFVGQVREDFSRNFHTHTDINAVGAGRYFHFATDFFHPFATASTYGYNTFFAVVKLFAAVYAITSVCHLKAVNLIIEAEFNLIFQFSVKVFQNHIIDVGSQMTDRSIQKIQFVLHAELFESGSGCGVHTRSLSAVCYVDFIYIFHQLDCLFAPDMFVECTAKIIGNIVFSIRKCTCTAKTAHDCTRFAVYAGFYFFAVDWAAPFFERVAQLKYGNL